MAGTIDHAPTDSEQTLGSRLVEDGLISSAQLLAALNYGRDHRLDLRQALLKLKLVDDSKIRATLSVPRPSAPQPEPSSREIVPVADLPVGPPAVVASDDAGSTEPTPTSAEVVSAHADQPPDLSKRERDIRDELKEIAATAASPDLVAQIFERAFESRATDIHFDPQDLFLRIRYRIDGQLHDVLELDPALATSLVSRLKVMADLNIVERRHAQDGRIQFRHLDAIRDLRVATMPTVLGEKVVVRVHEAITQEYGFDLLGLNSGQIEQLSGICAKPYGAVLVAGPVGAGKTTTLYTCLSRVNVPTRNVMTIEDPIERRLPGINQVQVDSKTDMTFGQGLKRDAPARPGRDHDRRDPRRGNRPHRDQSGADRRPRLLARSTPPTLPAPSSNLYDFKIPGYMLSNTLLAVISQRLLRKICPYCKVTFEADEQFNWRCSGSTPSNMQGDHARPGEGCAGLLPDRVSRSVGDLRDHGDQRHLPRARSSSRSRRMCSEGWQPTWECERCGKARSIRYWKARRPWKRSTGWSRCDDPWGFDAPARTFWFESASKGCLPTGGRRCDPTRSRDGRPAPPSP